MKITICGSMSFAREMKEISQSLEKIGHQVFLPDFIDEFIKGETKIEASIGRVASDFKRKHDLIRKHFQKIEKSHSILVVNKDKNGIKNYIGANALIEMSHAHFLNKKIFLLNGLPKFDYLLEEVKAMEPIILYGDLALIK